MTVAVTIRNVPEGVRDELAARTCHLRKTLTIYDAAYVAVAELLGVPLVTLDARLARAPGIHGQTIAP